MAIKTGIAGGTNIPGGGVIRPPVTTSRVYVPTVEKRPATMAKEASPTSEPTPDTPRIEARNTELDNRIGELERQAQQAREIAATGVLHGAEVDIPTGNVLEQEAESAQNKADLLKTYRDADEQVPSDVAAVTSERLSPYIKMDRDGKYSVDTVLAVKSGASESDLKVAQVTEQDLDDTRTYILAEAQYRKDSFEYDKVLKAGGTVGEDGSITTEVKVKPTPGHEIKSGEDALQELKGRKENPIPSNAFLVGYNEATGTVRYQVPQYTAQLAEFSALPKEQQQSFIRETLFTDKVANKKDFDQLKPYQQIDVVLYYDVLSTQPHEHLSVKERAKLAAEATATAVVPFYWTKNTTGMKPYEIAANVALDVLIVASVLGVGVKALKALSPTMRMAIKDAKVVNTDIREAKTAMRYLETAQNAQMSGGDLAKLSNAAQIATTRANASMAKLESTLTKARVPGGALGFEGALQNPKNRYIPREETTFTNPLKNLTPKVAKKIERTSGIYGLGDSLLAVKQADKVLVRANAKAGSLSRNLKAGTTGIPFSDSVITRRRAIANDKAIKSFEDLLKAQRNYTSAVNRFESQVAARYKPGTPAFDNINILIKNARPRLWSLELERRKTGGTSAEYPLGLPTEASVAERISADRAIADYSNLTIYTSGDLIHAQKLKDGYTRLYRGQEKVDVGTFAPTGQESLRGTWYTSNKTIADKYASLHSGGRVNYIDIPTNQLPKFQTDISKLPGGTNWLDGTYNIPKKKLTDISQLEDTVEYPLKETRTFTQIKEITKDKNGKVTFTTRKIPIEPKRGSNIASIEEISGGGVAQGGASEARMPLSPKDSGNVATKAPPVTGGGTATVREASSATMTPEQAAHYSGATTPSMPTSPIIIPKHINMPKRDVEVIRTTIQKISTEQNPAIRTEQQPGIGTRGATMPEVHAAEMINVSAVVRAAQDARTRADNENMTKSQADNQVKAAVQAEVKQQLQLQTKLQLKTSTKTAVRTPAPLKPDRPTLKKSVKIPVLLPKKEETDKEKRKRIRENRGALGWRMGELKSVGSRWIIILHPYQTENDVINIFGRIPFGANQEMRGPRSAFRTAKKLYGVYPNEKLSVFGGLGFMELSIIPTANDLRLSFKPKQITPSTGRIGDRDNQNISAGRPSSFPLRNLR
jgi:hypothetical protein